MWSSKELPLDWDWVPLELMVTAQPSWRCVGFSMAAGLASLFFWISGT